MVGCAECHMLRLEVHADSFDHNDYRIHVVVSPDDWQMCHATEREQYSKNSMADAYGNLFAANYLIDEKERDARRQVMQAACLNCHDSSWVRGHWQRYENTIRETNGMTRTSTQIMEDIWQNGFADNKDSPFNEAIERKWRDTWLFYANTIRFASAMGGGGDYGVFADGRYHLSKTLLELNDWLETQKKLDSVSKK